MKLKLINSNVENHPGYDAGSGSIEKYEYGCPCGKGTIVEEHENIPGFRDHDVYISCDNCIEKYTVTQNNGSLEVSEKL